MAQSRGGALKTYVIRRLMLIIPTLIGVTMLVFALTQAMPGGPIDQMRMRMAGAGGGGETGGSGGSGVSASVEIPEAQLRILKEYYGFDQPLPIRYGRFLAQVATGDLGVSFRYSEPVLDLIKRRFFISLYFGIITTLVYYGACIPLGIAKALGHRSTMDTVSSIVIFVLYSIPGWALGNVLLERFSVEYDWFPLAGFRSAEFDGLGLFGKFSDQLHHTTLPLICFCVGLFATMTMLMKNALMENMGADYVKTALAKGLPWKRAIYGHAVRNSLIPFATSFGGNVSLLLTGSILIERVFGIPGMGLLFFDAILARDYPIVMGYVLISSFLAMVGTLISDLCVAAVDPRVRFGE